MVIKTCTVSLGRNVYPSAEGATNMIASKARDDSNSLLITGVASKIISISHWVYRPNPLNDKYSATAVITFESEKE